MNTPSETAYLPQTDRLGLLHRGISVVMVLILMVFLSVFVSQLEPKIGLVIMVVCTFIGGKRLLSPNIWPLIAITGYGAALSLFFPGPRPEIGTIIEHPLFVLDCILLTSLVQGGQSIRRQYLLLLGMLFISVIGAVGDWTGHDMTALLPFEMPDDDVVNVIILQQGNLVRIRGFFTEGGVLGAVAIGVATMIVMGACVMLKFRVSIRYAWFGLLSALGMGGAILLIAVTKSGFVMTAAGVFGFTAVFLISRNAHCRAIAILLLVASIVGGTAFLFLGPSTITSYLRGEIVASIDPRGMTRQDMGGHAGVLTRYKCWILAFNSIRQYPLGVGVYGLGSVIHSVGDVGFTREMRYFFSRDNFGLKNALANLIAQTGLPGLALLGYWLFVAFLGPIRTLLKDASLRSTFIAGIYGASAVSCIVFLFSCELYPSFAFLLVLKFHADAVAQACLPKPSPNNEAFELIA